MVLAVDYENARVTCLQCEHVNVFNRATDLPDYEMISGVELPCRRCGQNVRIPIDNGNPPYELFIFEAYRLENERRYMQAVAMVAQAYEMFFALAIEAMLLWHPFHKMHTPSIEELNQTGELLFEVTNSWTYRRMRNLFIHVALRGSSPSFENSRLLIEKAKMLTNDPSDEDLKGAPSNIEPLLHELRDFGVDTLRNKVLHKQAYRPTEQEANAVVRPANRLLGDLWKALNLTAAMRGV